MSRRRPSRHASGVGGGAAQPPQPAGLTGPPSRAARRLLAALQAPDAAAFADPTREATYIVRASRSGLSVGAGTFAEAAVDELLRHDLAETGTRRGDIVISEAGRAHLLRLSAESRGEAFAAQHREMVSAERDGASERDRVAVNAAESPLSWLRRRRGPDGEPLIDAAAFEAGERLRRDLTFAGMLPSVTARWDGAVGGGAGTTVRDPAAAADTVIAARQRARAALAAVEPDFAGLLVDLCGFLKGLEQIERERRWPPRSGKVVVRLALKQLARHYGLKSEARGQARPAALRTWIAGEADAA